MEENNRGVLNSEPHSRVFTCVCERSGNCTNRRNALGIGDNSDPLLELARLVPCLFMRQVQSGGLQQPSQLGRGQHPHVRWISQDFDCVLNFGFRAIFGDNDVYKREPAPRAENPGHFSERCLRVQKMMD